MELSTAPDVWSLTQSVVSKKRAGQRLDASAAAALFTRLPMVLQQAFADREDRLAAAEEVLRLAYRDVSKMLQVGFVENGVVKADQCAAIAWGVVRAELTEGEVSAHNRGTSGCTHFPLQLPRLWGFTVLLRGNDDIILIIITLLL